jgi:hypothetical protein
MLTLCSATIDWSATGTWITGSATTIIALYALRTWKAQLQLQDRYQKVDALLEAFVLCVRAGYNWQWNAISNNPEIESLAFSEAEGFDEWREALIQYRLAWYKVMHLTGNDVWFSPDKLQKEVIAIFARLKQNSSISPESFSSFESEFTDILNKGLAEISKFRNS